MKTQLTIMLLLAAVSSSCGQDQEDAHPLPGLDVLSARGFTVASRRTGESTSIEVTVHHDQNLPCESFGLIMRVDGLEKTTTMSGGPRLEGTRVSYAGATIFDNKRMVCSPGRGVLRFPTVSLPSGGAVLRFDNGREELVIHLPGACMETGCEFEVSGQHSAP